MISWLVSHRCAQSKITCFFWLRISPFIPTRMETPRDENHTKRGFVVGDRERERELDNRKKDEELE